MEQDFRQPEEATPNVETVYVEPVRERFPCGDEFVRQYWDADKIEAHPRACIACRVILGTSRASVMPQDAVAAAFVATAIQSSTTTRWNFYASRTGRSCGHPNAGARDSPRAVAPALTWPCRSPPSAR